MKRWFTLFAVMIVALGSVMLAGCSPEEEGEAEGDAAAEEASSVAADPTAAIEAAAAEAKAGEGS